MELDFQMTGCSQQPQTSRPSLALTLLKKAAVDRTPSDLFDSTNPDWAPSLHLGYSIKQADADRYERSEQRRQRKRRAEAAEPAAPAASEQPCGVAAAVPDVPPSPQQAEEVDAREEETGVYVQTDMAMSDIRALEEECIRLNDCLYTEPKVAYYTGMASFTMLLAVFKLLEPFIAHGVNNSLTKFQEFFLFLMKIKLNLQNADLAFRFNVSESTVSRIFDKWLHVAYCRLKSQISWPERSALQRTMPQAFYDTFGSDVAVIIDCFEVKIERPSSYLPRSETWSTYKGSNTAKYLIGIAPQGVVTFISEGWGGRISDKHITGALRATGQLASW
ncbi:uncharacterized protein LOC125944308 [Dermacentor silvarum]|uniref:uncharacterized protein LOC125944308 n=1 Tax=Dermacentor silvarum TaxID=543639 RepID=UPI002100A887|nr:uncharacterized protein LOC125944308 [Dermacentor silvarum]